MGIDFYDKWLEDEIKDRERIGGDMYDHRDDYVKRDKYSKLEKKFEKAKEALKSISELALELYVSDYSSKKLSERIQEKAEQFLKEIEND